MLNNSFIQAQENLYFLVKAKNVWQLNNYLFNQIGINNKLILFILDVFSPCIYVVNFVFALLITVFKFVCSLFSYRWKVDEKDIEVYDKLFLFFINHFPDRCKAANLYEESKYWVVSPAIDIKKYNLKNKVILDYRQYLSKKDALIIFGDSLLCLGEYLFNVRYLCLIHKLWDFYEVKYSLQKISRNSILYFANQSDKYALLFDNLNSKGKVLLQHGIVANWGDLPYRLNSITEFYSMSNKTWGNAFKHLLNCKPRLVVMKPTISLTTIPDNNFSVLIVAGIDYVKIEQLILKKISKNSSIRIFVKKHPALEHDNVYKEMQKKYGFNYIVDKKFPKVDFVISYYSTLAYEYMAYGIPVYVYMTAEEFNMSNMMLAIQECINNKQR